MTTNGSTSELPLDKRVLALVSAGVGAAGFLLKGDRDFVADSDVDGIVWIWTYLEDRRGLPDDYSIDPVFALECEALESMYKQIFGEPRRTKRTLAANAGNILNRRYLYWTYSAQQLSVKEIAGTAQRLCETGLERYWSKRATVEQCAEAIINDSNDTRASRYELLAPALASLGHQEEARDLLRREYEGAKNERMQKFFGDALGRISS